MKEQQLKEKQSELFERFFKEWQELKANNYLLSEEKAELVKGKYYKFTGDGFIGRYDKPCDKHKDCHALIGVDGESVTHNSCHISYLVLATHSEVEESLEAQSKKIGYKKGDKLIYPWYNDNNPRIPNFDSESYYDHRNDAFSYKGVQVYMGGQWATIVKEELLLWLDESEIVFEDVLVKIKNRDFNIYDIEALLPANPIFKTILDRLQK